MGTRVVEGKIERGNLEVGVDAAGVPYAKLGGTAVAYEDGGEIDREARLEEHTIHDQLRMDTVGPPGRQAARFVYAGEVIDDDPAVAGVHYLTCWVPFPETGRAFEVSEDGFESVRDGRRARLVRWGLMVGLFALLIALLAWGLGGP